MPSVNDFMVILIIPMLDYLVYPHLEKTMGYKVKSLHKVSSKAPIVFTVTKECCTPPPKKAIFSCSSKTTHLVQWLCCNSISNISAIFPPTAGWWHGNSCLVIPNVRSSPALPPYRVIWCSLLPWWHQYHVAATTAAAHLLCWGTGQCHWTGVCLLPGPTWL